MEAAIAVIMVSVTAFRSLLGIKAQKAREKRKQSKVLVRYFKKTPQNESDLVQLPSIPGATLTGDTHVYKRQRELGGLEGDGNGTRVRKRSA